MVENTLKSGWAETGLDHSDNLEFITQLVQLLYQADNRTVILPSILEFIGSYLNADRVTLFFDRDSETREFTWINQDSLTAEAPFIQEYGLKRSGPNNRIFFHMAHDSLESGTLLKLVVSLLDTSLAFNQTIRFEHSQRKLAESINEISQILISTLDHDELLSLFLDQLETLVPYDSATVMLMHDGLLHMHASRGFEEYAGPVDIAQISFIPSETFLVEEVMSGTQPIILSDTRECPQWVWSPCGKHIRSWMGVPLRVKGTAIGFFSIDKSTPDYFNEKHAQLASVLAVHAAMALDNALLFRQVQDAHRQLQGFSARIIEVQEKERQKIARELHDESGQALLALRAELRVLQHHLSHHPEEVQHQLEYLDQIVLDLSRDLARLACDLRPPTLSSLGLVSALDQYITDFGHRMKVRTDFVVPDVEFDRLPDEVELVCYRIVQEALTNLAKHSQADHVRITLSIHDRVLGLAIHDNGIGIRRTKLLERQGYGLLGIRERLSQIHGSLQVISQPGKGTELSVTIPLER